MLCYAGLLRSTLHGLQDLVAFPLAAIEARSAAGFVAGVGLGSASLVRNLSGVPVSKWQARRAGYITARCIGWRAPRGAIESTRNDFPDQSGMWPFMLRMAATKACIIQHAAPFWHAGWTLMSISGFSGAFSRMLEHSLAARSAKTHAPRRVAPRGLYGGLAHGLSGLAGGVSSGVTGVVYAPYQGEPTGILCCEARAMLTLTDSSRPHITSHRVIAIGLT